MSGEEEKEVLDLPPKTVLLKFYSNCTQKSGLNGVFRGAQNFDTLAEQMFGRFWPQDVRPLFCGIF